MPISLTIRPKSDRLRLLGTAGVVDISDTSRFTFSRQESLDPLYAFAILIGVGGQASRWSVPAHERRKKEDKDE
jgi:hypothetical protein